MERKERESGQEREGERSLRLRNALVAGRLGEEERKTMFIVSSGPPPLPFSGPGAAWPVVSFTAGLDFLATG